MHQGHRRTITAASLLTLTLLTLLTQTPSQLRVLKKIGAHPRLPQGAVIPPIPTHLPPSSVIPTFTTRDCYRVHAIGKKKLTHDQNLFLHGRFQPWDLGTFIHWKHFLRLLPGTEASIVHECRLGGSPATEHPSQPRAAAPSPPRSQRPRGWQL